MQILKGSANDDGWDFVVCGDYRMIVELYTILQLLSDTLPLYDLICKRSLIFNKKMYSQ